MLIDTSAQHLDANNRRVVDLAPRHVPSVRSGLLGERRRASRVGARLACPFGHKACNDLGGRLAALGRGGRDEAGNLSIEEIIEYAIGCEQQNVSSYDCTE